MKETFGYLSLFCSCTGFILYALSIAAGKTRPHLFSWIIWGLVTAIVFSAQAGHDAGAGSWATGFNCLMCFVIVGSAFMRGEKNITRSDWIAFGGALSAIPVWYIRNDPLWSVILVTLIDSLGFFPTFRKSYLHPRREFASLYWLGALGYIFAIMALDTYSCITVFYPAAAAFFNAGFVAMIMWRRSKDPIPS